MSAMIRPNRLEVNDRFPMLGFTIRTHGEPRRVEVAVATDPALLEPDGKGRRSPSNFYSSSAGGPLAAPRGETVYVVPSEVLARFVGSEKLYFGLATASATGPAQFEIDLMPTVDSPYVSLRALTGRSLRRLRVIPGRSRGSGNGALEWAGDAVQPGQKPAERGHGAPTLITAPSATHYDDGFGPMPKENRPSSATPTAGASTGTPALAPTDTPRASGTLPVVGAKSMAWDDAAQTLADAPLIVGDRRPVKPPPSSALRGAAHIAAEAALLALSGPLAPVIVALRLAARASGAAGMPVSIGLGPATAAGLFSGATFGAGVIFGPSGELGVYGTAQFDVGFLTSINLTAQLTVVRGGIETFSGWSNSATVSGGEGCVGGGSALFDDHGNFQGISVQAGIGAGLSPVDFFVSVQRSVSTTFGMAAALGQLRPQARAMGIDPDTMGIEGPAASDRPLEPQTQAQSWSGPLAIIPDYSRASRFEASPAFTSRPRRTIDRIVIHITDANTTASTVSHFTRADADSSSHYLVGQDGEVVQFVREADIAWHSHGMNSRSIGIEHVCVNQHGATYGQTTLPALPPTEVEYAESAALVSYLCDKYAIATDRVHVIGHSEADTRTSHTDCPNGAPWDWDRYIQMIQRRVSLPTSQSLGLRPRRAARAFDAQIPLDPGVGGQSIGMNALQIGDIILSTTDAAISRAIRAMTSGQISHAMLYVDQGGQVVEAVGEGVRLMPLGDAIATATVAVAFRVPDLSHDQRQMIADAAGNHLGQPYNHIGIARQAVFQIEQRLCATLPNGLSDRCRAFAGRIDMGTQSNDQFFCSELVLDAFRTAGRPLTSEQPNWASPDDIATLRFDYSKLRYIGHLKAAPSGGLFGHLLAYAEAQPARAMSTEAFSLNWDDVELVPQPSDTSCWAAAATMVIGWNERVSIDPAVIARAGAAIKFSGQADVASNQRFAEAIGLVAEAPADYSVDGFRHLLDNYGPLWVGKVMGSTSPWNASSHAVTVTGVYSNGTDAYLRVSDPWDRVIGSPGAPGSYQNSHATGSRYIIKHEDFMREYDADQAGDAKALHTMILHAPGTGGRTPNRGSAATAGYAQSYEPLGIAAPAPSREAANNLVVDPSPGVTRRVETTTRDGVRFTLQQLDGMRWARTQPALSAPALSAEVSVADWPRMPDDHGGTFGAVKLAWHHGGGAIGDIHLVPKHAGLSHGWSLAVEGRIIDGPDSETVAAATVELRHHFSHLTEPDHRSVVRLVLRGDGTHDRSNEWELAPVHVGA